MIGYPSGQDGAVLPLGIRALSRKYTDHSVVFFFTYNKSIIDQACSVKMAGYWPRKTRKVGAACSPAGEGLRHFLEYLSGGWGQAG